MTKDLIHSVTANSIHQSLNSLTRDMSIILHQITNIDIVNGIRKVPYSRHGTKIRCRLMPCPSFHFRVLYLIYFHPSHSPLSNFQLFIQTPLSWPSDFFSPSNNHKQRTTTMSSSGKDFSYKGSGTNSQVSSIYHESPSTTTNKST